MYAISAIVSYMKLFSGRKRHSVVWNLISVSSQLDKYTAELQSGSTLSVYELDFWHMKGSLGLPGLA